MADLDGKGALITGASGGIGGSIARHLHARGATVALTGTRRPALEELAGALGRRAHILVADLGDRDQVGGLVKRATEAIGGVDILVNNAGLARDNLLLRMKAAEWDRVLEVNLRAAFALSQAALRGMMKKRWGRIISISSVVGTTGNPGQANYAASKAGLVGLSKSLAQEVASRGITVNCIAPGFIETAMTAALAQGQREALLSRIPAGAFGSADDIGAAAAFLAGPGATYITGQTLHINGGMAMI